MKNLIQKIKNPKILQPLLIGVVILVVIGLYLIYQLFTGRVFIDDSLVDGPIVTVLPSVAGTLTEMDAYEGEHIKKGDSLGVVAGQNLHADSDGLVVMADNQIGSSVTTQTPIVELINPQDMRIAGTIDENKGLDQIKVGQVVSFTVDALPGQTFWGYVDEIGQTAKQTQISFDISSERPTQQFVVYAKFNASTYPAIKNGMSAKMTVFTETE